MVLPKFLVLLLSALTLTAFDTYGQGPGIPANLTGQKIYVVFGETEATVMGKYHYEPADGGQSNMAVSIPVLLPNAGGTAAGAYAMATPSVSIADPRRENRHLSFTPTGVRNLGPVPGGPKGWSLVSFDFTIPPQLAGQDFEVLYVQPQLKNVALFFPVSPPRGEKTEAQVTFVPGEGYGLQMLSRNSKVSPEEGGMISVRPIDREIILMRKVGLKQAKLVQEKKSDKPKVVWKFDLFDKLFPFRHLPKPNPGTN